MSLHESQDSVPKSVDLDVAVGDDDDVGVVQEVQDPPRTGQLDDNIIPVPRVPTPCRVRHRDPVQRSHEIVIVEVEVLVEVSLLSALADVVSLGLQVVRVSQHQVGAHHRRH